MSWEFWVSSMSIWYVGVWNVDTNFKKSISLYQGKKENISILYEYVPVDLY